MVSRTKKKSTVFLVKTLFLFCYLPSLLFAQVDTSQQLSLLFVGDIMGHTPQIKSAEIQKNKRYDYKPCFEYIAPILRKADLAIGNLEVTLPGRPPYTGYPIFRSPDDLARDLHWAGFDVLLTANNHSNDGKKQGVIHTIETLRNLGIHQTGTFKNKKEKELFYPLIINKNGFKLAFLNYTYGTNDIPTTPPTIVNKINKYTILQDLNKAKKLQPNAIIVVLHWGYEYQLIENNKQKQLAEWLLSQGADLIIGAHPHVVQPIIEKVITPSKQPTQKKLIAYSLGNFISNQESPHTDGGVMLEVILDKSPSINKAVIHQTRFIPIWRHIQKDYGKITYRVLPIAAMESARYSPIRLEVKEEQNMKNFARITRARLRHNGAIEKRVTWSDIFGKHLERKQLTLKK